MTDEHPTTDSSPRPLRAIVADALRFWERGRVFYNGVLLAIVVSHFVAGLLAFVRRVVGRRPALS